MITGALIFLGGLVVGRLMGLLPSKKSKKESPKALCGCNHSIGFHANKTGRCTGTNRVSGYDRKCGCQHYDGPKPIEDYFNTPLLPGDLP